MSKSILIAGFIASIGRIITLPLEQKEFNDMAHCRKRQAAKELAAERVFLMWEFAIYITRQVLSVKGGLN